MTGVELGRAHFRMRLGVDATGAHEVERLGDAPGEFLVAVRLRAVLDEAEHPLMRVREVRVTAGREGAQQVERRRRLAIGHQHAVRIGRAALFGEGDVVDDVATIGRKLDAVLLFGRRRAGLRELARDAATFTPPAGSLRRSSPPPSAKRRGRNRGYCWRCARRSSRRNRRPARGKHPPRRLSPARASALSLRPRTPAGERVASCFSVASSAF